MLNGQQLLQQVLDRLTSLEERLPPREQKPPVVLDIKLMRSFLRWSAKEKRNSKHWVRRQRLYLRWWADELDGRCLRTVSVPKHVLPPLDEVTSRTHRIAVLKCLYSWLRRVRHQLAPAEDPTLGVLTVPQATPAQHRRSRVITRDHYRAVRTPLVPRWRDCLDVLAATGWHVSELERWLRAGSYTPLQRILVCPRAKAGNVLRTRVSKRVGAIAVRLLQRRSFSEKTFRLALHEASRRAKRPPLRPGCLRHSVATYAYDCGEPLEAVADFLNHRSKVTTQRFYATHATPRRIRNLADG